MTVGRGLDVLGPGRGVLWLQHHYTIWFSSAFQFSVTFDFPPDSQLQLAAQPAVNVPGSR
jgi:hypothetical protein